MPNRRLSKISILKRAFGSSVGQNVENQHYPTNKYDGVSQKTHCMFIRNTSPLML